MAYLTAPLRLYEPMYACTLQCDQMQLGSLYSVVSRRRGAVSDEDIIEGTSLFVLSVTLPIVESFGFSQVSIVAFINDSSKECVNVF
jgi:translation elongation factor EF-G